MSIFPSRDQCLSLENICNSFLVVCVVTCPFDISVGVGAFVIGLGQISSFLSYASLQANAIGVETYSINPFSWHMLSINADLVQYI